MKEIEILEARIEEYKKTVRLQENEIDLLNEQIASLIGNLEIYQKQQDLLNKVLDKVGCNGY